MIKITKHPILEKVSGLKLNSAKLKYGISSNASVRTQRLKETIS